MSYLAQKKGSCKRVSKISGCELYLGFKLQMVLSGRLTFPVFFSFLNDFTI